MDGKLERMAADIFNGPVENTDRELWRGPDEGNGDYYADRIFMTEGAGLGIDCGGHVIVRPLREWHRLASGIDAIETWRQRCERFDDMHITTHDDIQRVMQEEIDELRGRVRNA